MFSSCCAFSYDKVYPDLDQDFFNNIDQDIVNKANNGDPESCFILSKHLIENSNNYFNGEYYLIQSIKSDFGEAILYYSEILHLGTKIQKNDKKAEKYLKYAVKKNIPAAPVQLCQFYFDFSKYSKGIKILKKSVKKNNTNSMIYLSQLYQEGIIVEQNNEESFRLLKKASEIGDKEAVYFLAEALKSGTICDKNIEEAASLHKKKR